MVTTDTEPRGLQPGEPQKVVPEDEQMSHPKILVIEDEEAFSDALKVGLGSEGFDVVVAGDGATGLEAFSRIDPDMILLDLMLPKMSGVDVLRTIRAQSTVPIIMVTARSAEVDAVVGLEVGADDYVTKPYRLRELVARMRAVMRRSGYRDVVAVSEQSHVGGGPDGSTRRAVVVGDISLDPSRHEVEVRGELTPMPLKEFELLRYLMENVGLVLSRDALIDRVWGHDYVGQTKTLDVHIKRLRSKLEEDPSNPSRIVTIRGLGYKFQTPG